jgi:hypothetical protein
MTNRRQKAKRRNAKALKSFDNSYNIQELMDAAQQSRPLTSRPNLVAFCVTAHLTGDDQQENFANRVAWLKQRVRNDQWAEMWMASRVTAPEDCGLSKPLTDRLDKLMEVKDELE